MKTIDILKLLTTEQLLEILSNASYSSDIIDSTVRKQDEHNIAQNEVVFDCSEDHEFRENITVVLTVEKDNTISVSIV